MDKLSYIGVIGDVHTEDKLLQLAINFLKAQNVEKIVCVGDIADGKGDINRCFNILKKEKIMTILGNHDRWLLTDEMRNLKEATFLNELSEQSKKLLESLPLTVEFFTSHGLGLLCHGLENNDMARVTPDDYGYSIEVNADLQKIIKEQKYKYIINGHTHYHMVRKFQNITIINAGTLKREHEPCFLIVNFATKIVQFFKFTENSLIEEMENIYL
jgi:predicted phosphodiesterase